MKLLRRHSRLIGAVCILATLAAAVFFVRPWLASYLIRSALEMAGASEIKFRPITAIPSRVVVEDLEFRLHSQSFAARRLTLERARWWRMTLGRVRVEGARVVLTTDTTNAAFLDWPPSRDPDGPAEPLGLPVESLVLEGEITVRAAMQPDRQLTLKLEGAPKGKSDWVGSLVVDGPGFKLAGGGTLLALGTELDFQIHSAELDLQTWQGFIQRSLLLPGGPWQMGGRLTGVAEGHVTARRFAATARVSLREGWMHAGTQDISAAGAEADLEFSDLWKLRTKSGVLRIREMQVGRLALTDVTTDFGLRGAQTATVAGSRFALLGGHGEVSSFDYVIHQAEILTTLRVDGIDLARLQKLMADVSGDITGRVGGALRLRVNDYGVRVEPGAQLVLQPGPAELVLDVTMLARSGVALPPAGLMVLRTLGDGPVRLRLDELRLDVRPPDLPLGCSARLHVAGETTAGRLEFDFDVNGMIERYVEILTPHR